MSLGMVFWGVKDVDKGIYEDMEGEEEKEERERDREGEPEIGEKVMRYSSVEVNTVNITSIERIWGSYVICLYIYLFIYLLPLINILLLVIVSLFFYLYFIIYSIHFLHFLILVYYLVFLVRRQYLSNYAKPLKSTRLFKRLYLLFKVSNVGS